jgi:hypothetical protein
MRKLYCVECPFAGDEKSSDSRRGFAVFLKLANAAPATHFETV